MTPWDMVNLLLGLLALSNGYNHNYNKGLASNKKLTNLVQIRSMRSLMKIIEGPLLSSI
jgi:hypothetical protein